ncbi:hypothetical protein, partial [uncultured Campylobacter sp.]|uniref:hypothetical protein n=1 Tax=uncultured Campylobacter sp. TaxID=218934 RepID=UPI00262E649D
ASKNFTVKILKFRGKAQIKFSRKFLICGKEEFAVMLQPPILGYVRLKSKFHVKSGSCQAIFALA